MENTTSSQPADAKTHGAKTLFWYLSLFFTLGIIATAFGAIVFQLINKLAPLEITQYNVYRSFSQSAVKYGIAALLVGTPVFFLFMIMVHKAIRKGEVLLQRGVRQWISYIILFIVVATAIGDVITAVLYILNGDYTIRFFLKVLTILAITAWIFCYYWLDLKSKDALTTSPIPKIMGGVTAAAVVAAMVGGFLIIDSPATTRAKAFDQRRSDDISYLQNQVREYYRLNEKLPEGLTELTSANLISEDQTRDPQTKQGYLYRKLSEDRFELCATFATDNRGTPEEAEIYGPYGRPYLHSAGENCFAENATPDYPELDEKPTRPIPAPLD